jgi:hypothetical protein
MGIELEWEKKNRQGTGAKHNKFFLTDFSSKYRIFNITKTHQPTVFREFATFAHIGKASNSNNPSFNQYYASKPGYFSQVFCFTGRLGTCIRMMPTEIRNPAFKKVNGSRRLIRVLVTFSFSYVKRIYSHNWKNIFVHLSEKTNLLIRSDKNTGVSSLKILQTTTI